MELLQYRPWTRDGRVRVYTAEVAPGVSGTVVSLPITDTYFVHKGDVLFQIDPRTYENKLKQATGRLAQAKAQAAYLEAEATRRAQLSDLSVSAEQRQNAIGIARAANDAVLEATGALDQASLDLERTTVRSPVNGWISDLICNNRDRGASRNATPPTPPGIRVRTTAVRRIKHPPSLPWKTAHDP